MGLDPPPPPPPPILTSRSSRPTNVLWPCHALSGSLACLRKYLAVLKLLTKYVFASPYANNTSYYLIISNLGYMKLCAKIIRYVTPISKVYH